MCSARSASGLQHPLAERAEHMGGTIPPMLSPTVPAVILAPMEGLTDAPMRAVLSAAGGFTFCVSEFVRVSHTPLGPHVFRRRVPELVCGTRTPSGVPVQVQI